MYCNTSECSLYLYDNTSALSENKLNKLLVCGDFVQYIKDNKAKKKKVLQKRVHGSAGKKGKLCHFQG